MKCFYCRKQTDHKYLDYWCCEDCREIVIKFMALASDKHCDLCGREAKFSELSVIPVSYYDTREDEHDTALVRVCTECNFRSVVLEYDGNTLYFKEDPQNVS